MTAKKKYYYLFTSILFFNILGVLFDTFFSQKLWDKILFKTVKHHIFFDSAFFEFFYFYFFYLCLLGIFFSLLLLIVTSLLHDSEQSEQIAEDSSDSEPVSELIQTLVSILQLNGVFVRNLFRGNVLRNSMNQKTFYVKDEVDFLLFVEDRMHTIPDIVINLLHRNNDKRIGINIFLLSLVSGNLKEFNSIVQDKNVRLSYKISDTDNIQSWLSFGLKGIVPYSEKAIGLMESIVADELIEE